MNEGELRMLLDVFDKIDKKLANFEIKLDNKLKVNKIIDVNDDKVHKVMQVVKLWETPDGVIVHVR